MKKLENIDQLEALFKSKLDKAEAPAPDVWPSLAQEIGVKSSLTAKLGSYFSSMTNVIKVALFVGGVSTVGILLYKANVPEITVPQGNEQILPADSQATEQTSGLNDAEQGVNSPSGTSESPMTGPNVIPSEMPMDQVSGTALSTGDIAASTPQPVGEQLAETGGGNAEGVVLQDAPALSIESMGHHACVGETRTFISADHRSGDWYINAQPVKTDAEVMSHRFTQAGSYTISLKVGEEMSSYLLNVSGFNGQILASKGADGLHEISLSDPEADVQEWIVEGQVVSDEQVLHQKLKVGANFIKVKLTVNGCTLSKDKVIEVKGSGSFSSPNIFTPNGDGKNDRYLVQISHHTSFYLQVIDSRNQRVYASTDPEAGWDGMNQSNGAACPDGVYQVIVKYQLEGETAQTAYIKLTLKR